MKMQKNIWIIGIGIGTITIQSIKKIQICENKTIIF